MFVNTSRLEGIIAKRIYQRLNPYFDLFKIIGIDEFYVAGSSLNQYPDPPNDFDIYPKNEPFDLLKLEGTLRENNIEIVSETKNAITIKFKGMLFQFCDYYKESLKELITSFDFSHVQVGAVVKVDFEIVYDFGVEFTEKYVESLMYNQSEYTGSDYPLSSLLRAFKYYQRGLFPNRSYISAVISILRDMISRGFKDYDDFKDQLDAIDLDLIPEQIENLNNSTLEDLFELLRKDKKS